MFNQGVFMSRLRILSLAVMSLVCAGSINAASVSSARSVQQAVVALAPSPAVQFNQTVQMLRNNDLLGLMKTTMSATDYQKTVADYEADRKKPITADDRKKFAEGMGKLTGQNAVNDFMKEMEPKLAEMKPQLAGMIPMFSGMALMGVQNNKDITPVEKTQMTTLINNATAWAQKTDFTDPAKLRHAMTILSNAVKGVGINSPEQVKALSFEQLMAKMGPVMGATKQAVAVYGLSMDDTLNSLKIKSVTQNGNTAKLKISYSLFGAVSESDMEMVLMDGRWVNKSVAEKVKEAAKPAEKSEG
jgi:hypothetical protein